MLSLAILCFSLALVRSQLPFRDDVVYYTAEHIQESGYPSEKHIVHTPDGYILEMHRIPHGRSESSSTDRPVVFIMHGMSAASFVYIIAGPDQAIAYLLADAGFDVWMGNARGTKPSRFHETLDPDDNGRDFFEFTWDEIGGIDLPTMIEYVLTYTGRTKLHYIGHSQGGTSFLVLNSLKPEYNEKFLTAHLMAGVGYNENFPDGQLRQLAQTTDMIYTMARLFGMFEMYPPNTTELIIPGLGPARSGCAGEIMFEGKCWDLTLRRKMREEVIAGLEDIIPGGGSFKQIAHYGQNIRDGIFRRYDHGRSQNNVAYGTDTPPNYNVSLITANVTLHYSLSDDLLSEADTLAMAADMPNTVARKIERESFTHNDYLGAPDAREMVLDYIVEDMLRVESENAETTPVSPPEETPESPPEETPVSPPEETPESPPEEISVEPETDAASLTSLSILCKMYLIYLSLKVLL